MRAVIGAALEGDEAQVRRLLAGLSDAELEQFYLAWRLVGTCLGPEFDRRGDLPMDEERARRVLQRYAEQDGMRNYLGHLITPKEE